MFRIVLDIREINYDKLLDTFFEQMRGMEQNGSLGGMKLPPMMNLDFLKNMPQETKNGMVASAINAEQKRMIDMVEMLAVRFGYPAKIHKVAVASLSEPDCTVRLVLDVESMNFAPAIEKICMALISQEDLPSVMGTAYQEGITLSAVPEHMSQQTEKQKEYFVLKSMSDRKQIIMERLEKIAAEKEMLLQIHDMRFMMQ
ncbi:MAG: hypothetical protein PHE02_07390 [Lachnospiraceae bacterium]|nr:hypothetical protein [Lachnospiraceae bacterium]